MKSFPAKRCGFWLPLFLLVAFVRAGAAEVMPPKPDRYFNDYAGIVSASTAETLNRTLEQFEKDTSNQILVVIYPHMQSDSSIEDYTERAKDAWGVGQKGKDNGAVLFVFSQDHKLFIQTNYGLEGALPDGLCKQIIDTEITPRFRQGDYDGGLTAGVTAILAATRGEYKGTGTTVDEERQGSGNGGRFDLIRIVIFFVVLVGWSIIRSRRHVVYRSSGRTGSWGGGPWIFPPGGGGFGGGGGGGGGFSGGGFSGGGGSGGGGGAGGSW